MILSDLLGLGVFDQGGNRLGRLIDARFAIERSPGQLLADARLQGIVVSPHSRASFLGYARKDVNAPILINDILSWMHRGTFYVPWASIQRISHDSVHLRENYEKFDPSVPAASARSTS